MNIAFILETALIILAAFLIGAILGYLIRCLFFKPQGSVSPPTTQIKPSQHPAEVESSAVAKTPVSAANESSSSASVPTPAAAPVEPVPAVPAPAEPAPAAEPPSEESAPAQEQSEHGETMEPGKATENGDAEADGKPIGLSGPRDGQKDDLKRIKGIGPKIEGILNELGIFHFDQIASWSPATIDWINGFLSFKGRVQRENWIDQAKALASGGETEFSKRVDKGKVPSSKK